MRWIAGLLLVGAAILKATELLIEPASTLLYPLGGVWLSIQIGVEFAIGLLVLIGIIWRTLRWLVAILFSGFATYSLYLALNGATSCGCFGPISINPWWTFLLDLAIAIGLAVSIALGRDTSGSDGELEDTGFAPLIAVRRKVVVVTMALSVIITALLARTVDRRDAAAHGISTTSSGMVILEPERWIGERLPIAEFVDADLSRGEWVIVLHRHDCPACQEALPHYEQLASMGRQVALIEVPPYGHRHSLEGPCRSCRLKDDREWFVQTPVEIELDDAVVKAVKNANVP